MNVWIVLIICITIMFIAMQIADVFKEKYKRSDTYDKRSEGNTKNNKEEV